MSVQQFCLRWNNHQPNFISVFSSLLHNETLVDVTLAAEGNQLQAHKVVLSACSTYFESLFTLNPCKHPIVILKDVRYSDLKTLVDFMYYGEVNVSQERLPHIIKTAEMLKIKGLAEMSDAASLSKSDSKSSSGGSGSGGGDQLSANVNDGESVWGGHESHHQQHQQQQQQQQQQEQFHQQQQSQLQQQQHHQIQQSSNRRTPSPNSTMSPSTRRKRLRKSSTGIPEFALRKDLHQQQSVPAPPPQYEEEFRPSGVTSSSGEEHSSMEGLAVTAAAAGGGSGSSLVPNSIHIGHLETISTFGGASTASNLTTTVQQQQQQQNQRMLKESPNTELDHHHHHHQQQQQQHHHHHHDTSQESVDDQQQQHHIVMKTEIHELQQQSMPLDITTSSATGQSCPTQTHSGVQWTVVESGYPRFALASCQSNIGMSGGGNQNNNNNSNASSSNSNNNGAAASAAAQQQQQQHHHHQQAAATHQSTAEAHHHNQHNNSAANAAANSGGNNNSGSESGSGAATQSSSSSSGGSSSITLQYQQQQQQQGSSSYQQQSTSQIINSYPQSISTPTSPQGNESSLVQSVYSQGATPNQSPTTANAGSATSQSQTSGQTSTTTKRKRSVNPQGDENFIRALDAVRYGGIGFCKAARLFGVNNRTLWLEYRKRGYPISRPSIKNRIKLEPNVSPPPPSTPTKEENTMENTYEHIPTTPTNIQMPIVTATTAETSTPIMCPPHAHSMGVMSFLDTRHVEFNPMRQRYPDATPVNPTAINLQGINFNSM